MTLPLLEAKWGNIPYTRSGKIPFSPELSHHLDFGILLAKYDAVAAKGGSFCFLKLPLFLEVAEEE